MGFNRVLTVGEAVVDDEETGSGVGQSHDDHDQGQNDLRRHRGYSLVADLSITFRVRLTSLVETMLLAGLLPDECEDFLPTSRFLLTEENEASPQNVVPHSVAPSVL